MFLYLTLLIIAGLSLNALWPGLMSDLFSSSALQSQFIAFLLVTLPISLYFAFMESSPRQASWGKKVIGLQVTNSQGQQLSFGRALLRTILKFLPWELAHTCIWYSVFAGESASSMVFVGFGLVYLLLGIYIISLLFSQTEQTLYDTISRAFVSRR